MTLLALSAAWLLSAALKGLFWFLVAGLGILAFNASRHPDPSLMVRCWRAIPVIFGGLAIAWLCHLAGRATGAWRRAGGPVIAGTPMSSDVPIFYPTTVGRWFVLREAAVKERVSALNYAALDHPLALLPPGFASLDDWYRHTRAHAAWLRACMDGATRADLERIGSQ